MYERIKQDKNISYMKIELYGKQNLFVYHKCPSRNKVNKKPLMTVRPDCKADSLVNEHLTRSS